MLMGVYVDDMIIATNCDSKKGEIQRMLQERYKMRGMSELGWVLNMRVTRDRENEILYLDQDQYTQEILADFNMENSNPMPTPAAGPRLTKAMCPVTQDDREQMRGVPYSRAVGKLNYLACGTRPDIAQAVSDVSRFLANPGIMHWVAVKRIFRYLRNPSKGIRFDGKVGIHFSTYCDSDFAGEQDQRRSRTGYVTTMAGGPVSWRSRLQRATARSSGEAEYMAAADATAETVWLRGLLNEVGCLQLQPSIIHEDNNCCILWSKDSMVNERNKHVAVRYHIVRQRVEDRTIRLMKISSIDNTADLLTKALGEVHFNRLRNKLMGYCP